MTSVLVRLFIKEYQNRESPAVRESYGSLGSIVGIICNIFLCAFKIVAGIISSSISIIADGLNNLADMGSSVITMVGFKLSNKPADRDHPFGHGRFEYVSAFIVSLLILLVGFELMSSSIKTLVAGDPLPTFSTAAIIILAVSILVKLWMYIFNQKLGKAISSSALTAAAKDSLNDCVSTAAILAVAIVSKFVVIPFNLDAILAIGVALFILWSGFSSAKQTLDELLGGPPSEELIKKLESGILSFADFSGIHDLIVHNYGPGRQFASVHVEVPHDVDIVECHEKIDLCEKYIAGKFGIELVIHMDPIDTQSPAVIGLRNKLGEAIKEIDSELSLHDFRMTPTTSKQTNLIFDVVVPRTLKLSNDELYELISKKAKELNDIYTCVITFDKSFI